MCVVAVMLLLSAGIAAEAMSYSFVSKASGRLGGPIRFEFYQRPPGVWTARTFADDHERLISPTLPWYTTD